MEIQNHKPGKKPPTQKTEGGFEGVSTNESLPTSNKLPAMQFYPGDWRKDPGVQSCCLAARGLWIEMLFLMHESTPRGFLELNERPLSDAQLARLTGTSLDELTLLIQELETAGVFSRDERGVIFSRRMHRDEYIRQIRSDAGKKGAVHGHKGAVHGSKGGRPKMTEIESENNPAKTRQKTRQSAQQKTRPKPPPSSSSSEGIADATSALDPMEQERKTKTPRKGKERKPRQPNPLFDAILEATGKDQEPSFIQNVCTSLKQRNFTPDDVRQFAKRWRELLPWANKDDHPRLTPSIIKKWIHVLREQPTTTKTEPSIKKAADHLSNHVPDMYEPMGGSKK